MLKLSTCPDSKTIKSRLHSFAKNYKFCIQLLHYFVNFIIALKLTRLTDILQKNFIQSAFIFMKKNSIRTSHFIHVDLRRVGTDACARFIRALLFSFKLSVRA